MENKVINLLDILMKLNLLGLVQFAYFLFRLDVMEIGHIQFVGLGIAAVIGIANLKFIESKVDLKKLTEVEVVENSGIWYYFVFVDQVKTDYFDCIASLKFN